MSWFRKKNDKKEEWESFGEEENTKIENAFKKQQKTLKLSDQLKIDFSHMDKKKERPIKREVEKDNENSPKAKKPKTNSKKGNSKEEANNSGSSLLAEYQKASAAWGVYGCWVMYDRFLGDFWLSGFEWDVSDPKGTLQAWLDCDDDDPRLEQISLFAQADGTGSLYGFWKYPGRTQVNAPVIFLGSEGEAKIVASSVSQFIALQAAGLDGDMLTCWEGEDEEFEASEECESFPQFVKWVKSKGIKPIPKNKVWKTIKQETATHPSLKEFLFPDEDDENESENEDDEN